jgi:hypothetical protein
MGTHRMHQHSRRDSLSAAERAIIEQLAIHRR